MPLLILSVPNFCRPDVSSVFHFFMLLPNTFCIFSATPNIIMHFFNQLWGTMSNAFLYSIHAIPSPAIRLLQFLNIILSINNWSFVPLDFLRHSICSSSNNLSLSRCSYSSSLSIPVNIFCIRGRHAIGLKLVTSFPFSLFFIISTILPVVGHAFMARCKCLYPVYLQSIWSKSFQEPSSSRAFSVAI